MRLPRARLIPVTIPATALADLALLLVLYFVLTTTYDADRLRIEIPVSGTPSTAEIGSPCVVVARSDARGGAAEGLRFRWFDGRTATREFDAAGDLWLEVSRATDLEPRATLVLKAEASVRWSEVDEVLDRMREAGARRVLLWTRPVDPDGEGGSP